MFLIKLAQIKTNANVTPIKVNYLQQARIFIKFELAIILMLIVKFGAEFVSLLEYYNKTQEITQIKLRNSYNSGAVANCSLCCDKTKGSK